MIEVGAKLNIAQPYFGETFFFVESSMMNNLMIFFLAGFIPYFSKRGFYL